MRYKYIWWLVYIFYFLFILTAGTVKFYIKAGTYERNKELY